MPKIKNEKQKYFIVLAALQVIFACIITINELMAVSRQFPMTNFPIEHKSSWARVLLFSGGAITTILVAWFFTAKKRLTIFLPSLKSVLLLAILPTLSGIVLSHYLSVIGWCCEHPFAFYFGFPFSFMLSIGGFDYSIQQYANYSLFEILSNSKLTTTWAFLPYQFFLDFLFWSNIVFIFLSMASLLTQRGKFSQQVKEQVQSEIS